MKDAIAVNRPTRIVMNHLDYVDAWARSTLIATNRVDAFVAMVERQINRKIEFYGFSSSTLYSVDDDVLLGRGISVEQSNERRQVCQDR